MQVLLLIMALLSTSSPQLIFDFTPDTDISKWVIVDDVVMGGRSSGQISLSPEGHGVFKGEISLENNGGFSSVRYGFDEMMIKDHNRIVLKLKGDGKKYQLRVKARAKDYYSYVRDFETSGEWQEIEIPLAEMYPSFRGRKLDKPNFDQATVEEIGILIGNKKEQQFQLLLDKIELR